MPRFLGMKKSKIEVIKSKF